MVKMEKKNTKQFSLESKQLELRQNVEKITNEYFF